MKRIIAIFLLMTAFFCSGADFVSHPRQEQHFALRRLARYINGNFKMAGKSSDVEIISDETIPPGEPRCEVYQRKHRIYINPLDDWQRDPGFCRRLIHLLLRAKCGSAAADLSPLPDWFICGISRVVDEQTASARLIRNQHTFTLLDVLAENGCFGNPADVLEVDYEQLSGAEKMFFNEYAKLLMLTLDRARGFSRLTVIIGDDAVIDPAKFNAAALLVLKNLDDKLISPAYRRIMWSDIVPPPEKFTLRCLEDALVSDVPELDKDGLPTGKLQKIRLEEFSSLFERDDFLFICRRAVSKLHTVSVGESRKVRSLLADLRYLLEAEISNISGRQQEIQLPAAQLQKNGGKVPPDGKKRRVPLNAGLMRTVADKRENDKKFDELMSKSGESGFTDSMRSFYRQNVVRKKDQETLAGRLDRMFSSGSKIDRNDILRYISAVKEELAGRTALRKYLDETASDITPVRNVIKFRRDIIFGGDIRQTLWLEKISRQLY